MTKKSHYSLSIKKPKMLILIWMEWSYKYANGPWKEKGSPPLAERDLTSQNCKAGMPRPTALSPQSDNRIIFVFHSPGWIYWPTSGHWLEAAFCCFHNQWITNKYQEINRTQGKERKGELWIVASLKHYFCGGLHDYYTSTMCVVWMYLKLNPCKWIWLNYDDGWFFLRRWLQRTASQPMVKNAAAWLVVNRCCMKLKMCDVVSVCII